MFDSVTVLPFNRHVGIQSSTSEDCLLEIPAGEQYLNHVGTVHAGAQLTLAEACSGEFLLQVLAHETDLAVVVRRVDAKFKKPAHGKVMAKINKALSVLDAPLAELAKKGRCLLSIHVDLYDQDGQHTLSSSFEWFLARTAKSS